MRMRGGKTRHKKHKRNNAKHLGGAVPDEIHALIQLAELVVGAGSVGDDVHTWVQEKKEASKKQRIVSSVRK